MKVFIPIVTLVLIITSCHSSKNITSNNTEPVQISESANDSTEYELIIFDTKFDTYLVSQPSMEFYSNTYYQSWNSRYVIEWNIRHSSPLQYGDFYETNIDYQPHIDYGIELNYNLYYYFLFIEKEYGITLIKRGKTSN